MIEFEAIESPRILGVHISDKYKKYIGPWPDAWKNTNRTMKIIRNVC